MLDVPFMPESLKLDPLKIEELDYHPKEYKEIHQEKLLEIKENDMVYVNLVFYYLSIFLLYINTYIE